MVPFVRLMFAAGCLAAAFAAESSKPFTAQQRRWWALQPAVRTAPPGTAAHPIDAFILAKLAEKQLPPSGDAEKVTLLRRVTLDVTGLMPTPDEVQAFLADESPAAFERVLDRLLSSPRYGERWARHWLDLARYSDSEGFKSDETRPNIWRYRDYVIDSFNADKPYDRFVKEQIAGDELYPGNTQALIATGFNRHFPDESNARNLMQRRQELLNDITDTVGATFLGLTYACARCHDHKFDPILQKDYYRLQAFFANTRIEDGARLMPAARLDRWEAQRKVWETRTQDIRDRMAKLVEPARARMFKEGFDKFPPEIQDAILTQPEQRNAFQWQMYYKAKPQVEFPVEEAAKKLKGEDRRLWMDLEAQLKAFDSIRPVEMPVAQAMIDNGTDSPKTHVLAGGAYDAKADEVQPGFLSILDPADAKITPVEDRSSGRRTALAEWLASPENPFTARVMVNRIWHYHFGRGIAATPSDFGMMGERPTHKELLDYLTTWFVDNGWSVKKLHKLILTSRTYQRTSAMNAQAAKVDPDNKLYWRFSPRRLEGESIRDAMLQVSGRLNLKMHGPGVFPPLPPGVVTRGGWKNDERVDEAERRSVYVFVRRNTRYPMFEAFDMPDTHESCARRNTTLTAPQALELLNNELVFEWARALAGRVLNDSGIPAEAAIERAWRLAYSRQPEAAEVATAKSFLERHTPILRERLARQEKIALPGNLPANKDRAAAAAFVDFCHMLLNSNEFVYLN